MGCAENTCCFVIGVLCCALRALSGWSETHLSFAVPCRLLLCSVFLPKFSAGWCFLEWSFLENAILLLHCFSKNFLP